MLREFVARGTLLDWLALAWFLACWAGYGWFADRGGRSARGLVGMSHAYRLRWAEQLMQRDNRIVDSALVGNLLNSVSFFANTTIYIIAGLVAVIGTLDKLVSVTADLPFARAASRELWEVRLLLLLTIFAVAYFKFTWSIRQFNLLSILIGAAPPPGSSPEDHRHYANKLATVNSHAGDEFNRGIRAYYFGLAAVSWTIHPWMFVAVTAIVVIVLYRRDFASRTLEAFRR